MGVEALPRKFGSLVVLHCSIANIWHGVNISNTLNACDENKFVHDGQTKVKMRESDNKTILPVIVKYVVNNTQYVLWTENKMIKLLSPPLIISSYPVLVTSTHQHVNTSNTSKEKKFECWPYKNDSSGIVCVLTTYVAPCLNDVEMTRVEIFNRIRLLYLQ